MVQNLVVRITLLAHHGGTDLTQPYAMSPSGSGEMEMPGNAVHDITGIYHECRTVQMALAQHAPYLQLLADDTGKFRSNDLQTADTAASATL